jgi:hypothetical protein
MMPLYCILKKIYIKERFWKCATSTTVVTALTIRGMWKVLVLFILISFLKNLPKEKKLPVDYIANV